MLVGVLSDTHGLLRPQALDALTGVEHILHAGDVGDIRILNRLREIAPTTAIRGNIDSVGPCAELPATEAIELGGHFLYMVHAIEDLDLDPRAAEMQVVISGHSHKPSITHHRDVLYLNPGSVGPRRFALPVTLALLHLETGNVRAEIVELTV